MKPKTVLIATLSLIVLTIVAGISLSAASQNQIPKESKEQPTKVKLAADSVDDKWGEVAFDHTNHATKNYTIDGKGVGTCIECHHTDQPKENLKAPLVTSERNVVLTADVLKDTAATPVKTCRQCHLQAGDDSKPLPVIKKDDKDLKVDNEVAYHTNCFACHDAALKARPDLATKISGSDPKGCVKCHVAK
jgi:nitrate reductase cytochrome c-type subunit